MVSEEQIRAVCARVATESDPEDLEQLLAGLRMMFTQYLRERSLFLANDRPSPKSAARTKNKPRKNSDGGPSSNAV